MSSVTPSERLLQRLCNHSFLRLWSYANLYRDQGRRIKASGEKTGDGDELCDLLVVFQEHIIIFSDKECVFPNSGNLDTDWCRWYSRTIKKSAQQIWGAERWIKQHPDRIFLDRTCTKPFPLELPDPSKARIHRVLVAHGVATRCAYELGGSGSLMIHSDLIGSVHCTPRSEGGKPFAVGQVDPVKGFLHILDDTTLEIVLTTLDTISDFVAYLTKKEKFLTSGIEVFVPGEEDLLAFYLTKTNKQKEHDFILAGKYNALVLEEGLWQDFICNPQRRIQMGENEVSYIWDRLIERFIEHALAGTQYYTTDASLAQQDKLLQFLAREPRTRRRMLAKSLLEVVKRPTKLREARVMAPSNDGDPFYVFLTLLQPYGIAEAQYREVRRNLLVVYCKVAKLRFPEAQHIVGIATEPDIGDYKSEDTVYYDATDWTSEDREEAESLQKDIGVLQEISPMHTHTVYEYRPRKKALIRQNNHSNKPGANDLCSCGSGRKYKVCCGK